MEHIVRFTINGQLYTVSEDIPADTTLNNFIRNHANLRGTKVMCQEGGCGACIVAVASIHPVSKRPHVYSVNSCLVPVFSCHGWSITTVEGLGDQHKGYHPIQKRLAAFNGTQCGYCSPGWVMNMHSIFENHKEKLTMAEVEHSFAGNVCRCTGYRPILDAFKTFAKDCDPELKQQVADIEELSGIKMCQKNGFLCTKSCNDYCSKTDSCTANMDVDLEPKADKSVELDLEDEQKWHKVYKVAEIFGIFKKEGAEHCHLVAGNTAKGVYPSDDSRRVIIDISDVEELQSYKIEDKITLGGSMTLTDTMKLFQEACLLDKNYSYLKLVNDHLGLVANLPIRNIGTLAGNLSIKHQHKEFQSDLFVLFETIGAKITIAESPTKSKDMSMIEYLDVDMTGKIIFNITVPKLTDSHVFKSYKIMPCAQNSHAYVNAGFLLLFDSNKRNVLDASIVYGGINHEFNHAVETEMYLCTKNIFDKSVRAEASKILCDEIKPSEKPTEPSAKYRKKLAENLFYKFLLNISPNIDKKETSGGQEFQRPVSKGKQDYDTRKDVWPLNKPIPKIEALVQCSGEAKYANDIPTMPGEVYGAFILSTVCGGLIQSIDASQALKTKGVLAVFTAKDIPGKNSYGQFNLEVEEVFCSEKVLYNGQVLGLVVAEREELARKAVKLVKVTYSNVKTNPVLTVRQALESPDIEERKMTNKAIHPTSRRVNATTKTIKGSFDFYGQYHYTMETQTCVCIPIEDGIDVYSATQWMDHVQLAISEVMKIPEHKINVYVRRLGGGYGAKISRPTLVAAACALAAIKLNRPVRIAMSMETNMAVVGKRLPYASDYEVGVNDEGRIQYLKYKFYADDGCSHNDNLADHTLAYFPNCYDQGTWDVQGFSVLTDTASNTACRSPGTTEGVAMIENVMEHIARVTEKDPLEIRKLNMLHEEDSPLLELIETIKVSSDFEKRKADIQEFNSNNKWRKRGISIMPLKYNFSFWGNFYSTVSIYHSDGTVAISHGGIEMGQGINTKVIQVCAHILGIPTEKIAVKPSNNFNAPNNIVSGGSVASEAVAYATIKACEILLKRLEPIKKDLEDATWEQLVEKAHGSNVDLCAHYMFTAQDDVKPYVIWATTVTEVEVDFLTGNQQILQVDILEDTGESLSPQIDVGQIEGAFIMGLGYWTSEKLVYDKKTGALLTNRSWNYKPPGAKDIPQVMNISFRRNAPNPLGVLRSKATGEPSLNTTISVVFAIRSAIHAFREENGKPKDEWCQIEMPCTPENILLAANMN